MATDTSPRSSESGDSSTVKRALSEIRELRVRLEDRDRMQREPIAVIGIGCRFPGASSPDEFWQLLQSGGDAIREVPRDRWNIDAYYDADPDAPGKMYTRCGGFLDRVDTFDARFFGITPREAVSMDPQQRILLEVAWEALEHAAQAPDRLQGQPVGVFVGLSATDYLQLELQGTAAEGIDAYLASGGSPAVASGRLSYLLGLQGPSLTVDTACSSSLVAVHLACHSLRSRECRMAMAGGVSLILLPELNVNFSKARMMAADGRCKTFDAAADGYVRSEGCGVAVLKRLSDAIADGDRILAVIRGSAVNQDGRSSGLTVPNGPAQEAVLRDALARGGVRPSDVSYIEAHGTGTSLGDPIEVRALGAVFGEGRTPDRPLAIGSVKTNIGHLEAAAGIAGFIKVVLALQHEEIPPHLHLRAPNPLIDWPSLPVIVPTTRTPWSSGAAPRRAGVSSFGFSGTNSHVVLEEAPRAATRESSPQRPAILPLSARSETALHALAGRIATHIDSGGAEAFADLCFTAAVGRAHFAHRLSVVGDATGAVAALRRHEAGDASRVIHGVHLASTPPEVAFLFTGQGAQYFGMGRELYATESVFRDTLDRCAEIVGPHMDRPLLDVLFADAGAALIDETIYTQPALFALEYALVALWRSWGVQPSFVMGHSLGEDVAACVAGVFTLEQGLPLIAARGRLMQELPKLGEMRAVFASEDDVRRLLGHLGEDMSIAAVNAPGHITISGHSHSMRQALATLEKEGIKTKAIRASHAFHSSLMDPMLAAFERRASEMTFSEPAIAFVSNLTGRFAEATEICNPQYWRRHIRETVRFAESVRAIWDQGCRVFVEIGPNPVLLGMAERVLPEGATWLPSLRQGRDDRTEILTSLAGLYAAGIDVQWQAVHRHHGGRKLALPTYPFERERYWAVDGPKRASAPAKPASWNDIAAAASQQAAVGPLDLVLPSYPGKWERLDDLAAAYVIDALRQLGVFTMPGERHDAAGLRARFGIAEIYESLLHRWLEMLASRGLLRADGMTFVADRPLSGDNPAILAAASREMFSDLPAPLQYLTRCGERLVDLLLGRESPLEMLFPNGSTEIADGLYNTSPVSRYSNAIARAIIAAAATASSPDRPLRILEIGAGTGGTTAGVLPVLKPDATEYCFTDVGALFLGKAQERFADSPFLSYQLLNVEKHPSSQGFAPHSYDIVVAANVLHATKNLHETLDHVAWLLAPNGLLVLCEATRHPFWFDVTTGLIGGWQRFADDLRHDVPLIAPSTWERGLLQHGFKEVRAYPEPGSPAEILGQHIILARGSGVADLAVGTLDAAPGTIAQQTFARQTSSDAVPSAVLFDELSVLPETERYERLADVVRDTVVHVLRLDPSKPPQRDQRLMDFGVDSLMAVEFRNVLARRLGLTRKLPATLIFDYPTVTAIAAHLMKSAAEEPAHPASTGPTQDAPLPDSLSAEELEEMSDEAVEALLEERLKTL